jgi:hypothetical protein
MFLTLLFVSPVLAESTTIAPSDSVRSDGATLNTFQPNGSIGLQSANGIDSNNVSALTGGVALQPAGDQSAVSALLLGGVEGTPQQASDTAVDHSSAIAMAIAAFGFVVAALLILRTSKRLEKVNEPLASYTDSSKPAAKPAKRKPKKVPKPAKRKPKSR